MRRGTGTRKRKHIHTSDASDASDADEVCLGFTSAFASPPFTFGNFLKQEQTQGQGVRKKKEIFLSLVSFSSYIHTCFYCSCVCVYTRVCVASFNEVEFFHIWWRSVCFVSCIFRHLAYINKQQQRLTRPVRAVPSPLESLFQHVNKMGDVLPVGRKQIYNTLTSLDCTHKFIPWPI